MNEVVILCGAYPQIKNVLYVVTHYYPKHPISLMIIGNNDLFKFFKLLNEKTFQNVLNIVLLDVHRSHEARVSGRIEKALRLLPDLVMEKRCLRASFDNHLGRLRAAKVFFFSRFFSGHEFYFLKRLDKSNRLIYMQAPVYDALAIEQATPANIYDLAYLARWKLAYGRDIVMSKHPLGPRVPFMPDKFFRERVSEVISPGKRDAVLRELNLNDFKVLDASEYSVIYFQDDLVGGGYIPDSETLEELLTGVFSIIKKHFSEKELALKYHPTTGENEAALPFGTRLPDFIPAEFIYNEQIKLYLGISSMALANVEKGVVVSLIDLIKFRDNETKSGLKEILIRAGKSKILFPKSLEEFEQILTGLVRPGPAP